MREIISLNENWTLSFPKGERPTEQVTLPHTWNAVDGMDGNGSYLRTTGVYTRTFTQPKQPLAGGRTYIEVLAAALAATVKVNGQVATTHEGGFSIFRADVTDLCHEGDNELTIEVSNEDTPSMYPASADFTFYGGLYRGVNLISVPGTHFDLDYFGGPGIKVTPKPTEDGGATFEIESWVTNGEEAYTVMYSIEDCYGNEVASGVRPCDSTKVTLYVPDAQLWSMDEPNLYTVTARLQKNNETFDEIYANVGVRSYTVTPNDGFSINGVPTPLRGVARHQDRLYKGNALTAEDHYEDAMLIKELGANTIRLAHYQHSQDFYDACDELGFAVWAEIPFISVFKKDPSAHQNCRHQMTELIIQNYNHPSIMFWGLSNEILIGGICQELVDNHHDLQKLVRELDPTRLTTIAHVSNTPVDGPMHHITDVESYNHYFGWYGGKMEQNGPWLDKFHAEHPDICIGISEYGTEGIINWHSNDPQCKDYTEEYQALYHEHLAQVFEDRPWVWATHCWNMFDFGCAARNEGGVAGRNNKGLMTIDRKTKKDSYFVYQAYWSKLPMVHIAGRRHAQRAGETTEIKVYSNLPEVSLYKDGQLVETKQGDKVFAFQLPITGKHSIEARSGEHSSVILVNKVDTPNPDYAMDNRKNVTNWFDGELDASCWSVKDNMAKAMADPKAGPILKQISDKAAAARGDVAAAVKDNPALVAMMERAMQRMTIESMLMQAGASEEDIKQLNRVLQGISKE